MALDARLLPVNQAGRDSGYAHTVLSLDRDYELFERIKKVERHELPLFQCSTWFGRQIKDGQCEGERTYGPVDETPYGEKMKYATAHELAKAMLVNGADMSKNNLAAAHYLAYIADCYVGIYWH